MDGKYLWLKVPNGLKKHFNEDFIKRYNEDSDAGYFLEVDVQYLEELYELHNNLPFLCRRIKIRKVEKLAANLHGKKYVIHIRNFKQILNHGSVFKSLN